MKLNKFEELIVWKLSVEISVSIYKLTLEKNFNKDFGLKDQIRRSSVSISSNIAEGFERNNKKEFIRFLKIAKGSAGELRSQIYISYQLGYFPEKTYLNLDKKVIEISSMIGSLIKYLQSLIN